VRRRDRHALADRLDGVLDGAEVRAESHRRHPGERAPLSGLKERCARVSFAYSRW
jgi:hypothetical protein